MKITHSSFTKILQRDYGDAFMIDNSSIKCKICKRLIKWNELSENEQDIFFHPKNEEEKTNLVYNKICKSCLRDEKIKKIF